MLILMVTDSRVVCVWFFYKACAGFRRDWKTCDPFLVKVTM